MNCEKQPKELKVVIKGKDYPLLDHQVEGAGKILEGFETKDRVRITHACRTGKTMTCFATFKLLESRTAIVFVPNLALVSQMIEDWSPNIKDHSKISICSERPASKDVIHGKKNVKDFLKKNKEGKFVVFCTYQSADNASKLFKEIKGIKFDLLIADEAHRATGDREKRACLIHFNSKIKASKRLYVTATPKFLTRKMKENRSEKKDICMSDKKIFGENVHTVTVGKAIDSGLICDYEVTAVGCGQDFDQDDESCEESAKLKALEYILEKESFHHCITFHSSTAKMNFFYKNLKVKGFKRFQVHGNMKRSERDEIFEGFKKAKKAVLINCKCLNEGINLPECDSVYYSDTKSSGVDIVQSACRPLTKLEGKSIAKIIVPIFHKSEDRLEDSIQQENFSQLVHFFKEMQFQDERLSIEINSISDPRKSSDVYDSFQFLKVMNLGDIKQQFFETVLEVKPTDIILREILEYKTAHPLVSMREASEALGRHWRYVQNHLKRNSEAKERWLEIEASAKTSIGERIISLKKENPFMTMAEISRGLGKTRYFVTKFFRKNPDVKKRWDKIEELAYVKQAEEIISLKMANLSLTMVDISLKLGKPRSWVTKFLGRMPEFKKRWHEIEKAEKHRIREQILSVRRKNRSASMNQVSRSASMKQVSLEITEGKDKYFVRNFMYLNPDFKKLWDELEN